MTKRAMVADLRRCEVGAGGLRRHAAPPAPPVERS